MVNRYCDNSIYILSFVNASNDWLNVNTAIQIPDPESFRLLTTFHPFLKTSTSLRNGIRLCVFIPFHFPCKLNCIIMSIGTMMTTLNIELRAPILYELCTEWQSSRKKSGDFIESGSWKETERKKHNHH